MNNKRVKLKDICIDMYQGINTSTNKIDYSNSGKAIIRGMDIDDDYINLNNCKYVSEDIYDLYKKKYNPKIGDLLFCNIGSIGKAYVLNQDMEFLISWNIFLIKVNKDVCSPQYLKWILNYFNRINKYSAISEGGAIKFISKKNILDIEIPLPKIARQKEIIKVLDKHQEIINKKKKQIILLEKLEQSQFYNIFNRYIKDRQYYQCIGDVINIIDYRGKFQKKTNSGVRLITSKNIGFGYYKENYKVYIQENEYKKHMTRGHAKANDVVLITEGGSLGNVTRIPRYYREFTLGQRVISMCENNIIKSEYLERYMLERNFQEEIKVRATGSYAKGIRVSELKNIMIPVPPNYLQMLYINILNNIEKNKFYLKESITKLDLSLEQFMNKFFEV